MSKLIVVIGATGVQGGGVVREFLKDPTWKIRAVTRNVSSDTAKALAAKGVEVVTANIDDVPSLVAAFSGATAIYSLTNFWEHIFPLGFAEAANTDYRQGVNLAQAAAQTKTLEHYVWATLPSAGKMSGGKAEVPHTDSKAEVDVYIREKLPELAKKTTYLWHGFYITNLAYLPMLRPTLLATANTHVLLRPVPGSIILPITGDPSYNTGLFVHAILSQPSLTYGRTAGVITDTLTIDELLSLWSKVTGKSAISLSCTVAEYDKLWPVAGEEFTKQLLWHEIVPDWEVGVETAGGLLTAEKLGVKGLKGAEESLVALKGNFE